MIPTTIRRRDSTTRTSVRSPIISNTSSRLRRATVVSCDVSGQGRLWPLFCSKLSYLLNRGLVSGLFLGILPMLVNGWLRDHQGRGVGSSFVASGGRAMRSNGILMLWPASKPAIAPHCAPVARRTHRQNFCDGHYLFGHDVTVPLSLPSRTVQVGGERGHVFHQL